MTVSDTTYTKYVQILTEELIPAMGCTEPIAIAYAAAKAREVLGALPTEMTVAVSGNIIKNVKSVVVPHTGGLRGIVSAAAAGAVAGQADRELEVISDVTDKQIEDIKEYLQTAKIEVQHADTPHIFDIMITARHGDSSAFVRIAEYHTNLVCIKKDGEVLFEKQIETKENGLTDRECLSIENIIEFADCVDIRDVAPVLERQIEYNMAIAEEGLASPYGANIGKTLLKYYGDDVKVRARCMAAAGSDARMSGCEMPVIIVSGSGNQGITASVPVIVYAKELGVSHEQMVRAVLLSDLLTIHLKTGIGRLSAYCGAVSAGCAAAAAISHLCGGGLEDVAHTLVNGLAIVSGMICDGAKASCAAKIAASVDAGLLGWNMFKNGQQFYGGDGIITKGVEQTIVNVGRLGRLGMRETDKEIIRIMTNQPAED